MMADGLWLHADAAHCRSPTSRGSGASVFGELVQIDGCEHHWFEDRGPNCSLLVYVDDATGRLMELRFVATESTFDYFEATQAYLRRTASRWRSTATSTASSA